MGHIKSGCEIALDEVIQEQEKIATDVEEEQTIAVENRNVSQATTIKYYCFQKTLKLIELIFVW